MFAEYYVECGATGKILGYAYTEKGAERLSEHYITTTDCVMAYIKKCSAATGTANKLSYSFFGA